MRKIIILILSSFIFISWLNANEHGEHDHQEEHQDGIKLSVQAEKSFEIKRVTGNLVPKSSIVKVGEEINLYRYRDGFYKRIDFQIIKKNGNQIHIKSPDLKPGDQIVVQGMGFIRVAEIAALGGAITGHAH